MNRTQSAAIPYRRDAANGLEILLVTSRRQGRWVLPKGNIKNGLLPHTSAANEAFEEGGVLGLIDAIPVATYQQSKIAGNGSSSNVMVSAYALFVKTELKNWPEKNIRERQWMSLANAIESVADAALRRVLTSFGIEFKSRDVAE